MNLDNPNNNQELIQLLKEDDAKCEACQSKSKSSWFLIKDNKPWKVMTLMNCERCGTTNKYQVDYIELNYGIEINCNFTNKAISDRICYINNDSLISISRNNELLIEFKCEDSFVDCVESLLLRVQELIEDSFSGEHLNSSNLLRVYNLIKDCQKDGIVELKIIDKTGYSKMCPVGKEYTECQEWDIEKLNETIGKNKIVEHIKIDKK